MVLSLSRKTVKHTVGLERVGGQADCTIIGVMSFSPLRVYKFIDARWGLTALCDRRLKISEVLRTNDPWELFPFEVSNPHHEQALEKARKHIAGLTGLLCFSGRWNHPIMWSHYADSHSGICLGFDIPKDPSKALKVRYKPTLQKFPKSLEELNELLALKILTIKNACWIHEEEYRWFPTMDTKRHGRAYIDFGEELRLREVFLGTKCELELTSITRLLGDDAKSVAVQTVKCSKRRYEMVIDD